jgi:NAD-dependent SIR2 family protein deacetylase
MSTPHLHQAHYPGVCQKCHNKIEPGDFFGYDEDRNILCQKCAEEDE